MNTTYVEERQFLPDRDDFKSIIKKYAFYRYIYYAVAVVAVVGSFLAIIFDISAKFDWIIRTCGIFSLVAIMLILTGRTRKNFENENIVKNETTSKPYLINLGFEAKKLYGSAPKTMQVPDNLVRPLLLNAEQIKRHMLIMATIGAGKSVFMKGMIEQHAILGGGGVCVDGKGTAEFAKEIYGLFVALGREDDFIHINFLDMDNTHTINPLLSGSALALYEILIALLAGEENEWKAKQKEYMKNILKLLVWRRDNEGLKLDFSILAEYMTLNKLVKEALKYRDKAYLSNSIVDYIQFVTSSIGIDYEEFLTNKSEDFEKKCMDASENTDLQGVYDASMSAQAWRGVVTNLKSDYGNVFNTQNPSISLWEAVQRNKFIMVTLPTMASDTTPKELGRLILGLIKGVAADKAEKAIQPKIPFICWFDEVGSYIIEGFGRLMSKSRSLGISIIPIFQSPAQIDQVGKTVGSESLERREILDVVGTHILMKNIHPETTEFYAKMIEEKRYIETDYIERRDGSKKAQMGAEKHFKVEKEAAVKTTEVQAMNNGEFIVFNDGKMYRGISATETYLKKEGKTITYEGKDMQSKIPITQFIPKMQFLKEVNEIYKNLKKAS